MTTSIEKHLLPVMLCLALLHTSGAVIAEPIESTMALPIAPLVVAPALADSHASVELDRQMASALAAMVSGDMDTAARMVRSIAARYPDFALAQLLSGELQALGALDPLQVSSQYAWSPRMVNLLLEARRRLEQAAVTDAQADRVPAAIIQPGSDDDEILVVDISDSTLYRYENHAGVLELRHKHYVSSGRAGAGKQREGDLKTPIGLYRITESLIDVELPALYGHGALVLDYPNLLDRRLGRTGHGIWLHGNPAGQLSRAPYSSEGCVTMSNEHVAVLMNELQLSRTQVILSESVKWHTKTEATATRKSWLHRFANWRNAWLEGDIATLQKFYHPSARPNMLDKSTSELSRVGVSKQTGQSAVASKLASESEPLLEKAAREHLAGIKPNSVSILISPQGHGQAQAQAQAQGHGKTQAQGEPEAGIHVKMSLPVDDGVDDGYAGGPVVLWWAIDENKHWQIIAEQRDNPVL